MATDTYKFVRVEDFFRDIGSWSALGNVTGTDFNSDTQTLSLMFQGDDGPCCLLLTLFQKDSFRVRFNPGKASANAYSGANGRSVVMNTFEELRTLLKKQEPYSVTKHEDADCITLTTIADGAPAMRLVIRLHPCSMAAYRFAYGTEILLWQSGIPAIRYKKRPVGDYAIAQIQNRPDGAVLVGFGEQGGVNLVKNSTQMNFFSFDNYTYNQVYGHGPLDQHEPLYHADPFFMELNGSGGTGGAYGLFVDNPAQVLIDTGVENASQTMFGVRFDDLDYYCFLGKDAADVLDGFTSLTGKSRLKPRYALGYHQGCYGYEDRGALEWAVRKYREHDVPLDGLHVDVDIQQNYETFTINLSKFPDPKGMFKGLRDKGVKCATNITPIISNRHSDYPTYAEGIKEDVFIKDIRVDADNPDSRVYDIYGGGNLYHTYENNLPKSPETAASAYNTGNPYVGEVNYGGTLGTTGNYPDLGRKAVREWWGKQYQYLFDQGLEMVWQDMTTPAIRDTRGDMKGFPFQLMVTDDFKSGEAPTRTPAVKAWNLYSYNLHKATYHGLNHLKGRGDKRNFIVGRGSFTGMQRFAALWTGDNASTWDFLRINVAQVLSLGLSGQAMSGQDIGGFATGEINQHWVGPELLMRWTMAGAFLPWFRNHYVRKGQKDFQEPFQYEDWFKEYGKPIPDPDLYAMVLPVCRTYIQRRYKLMQLFYDLLFENTQDGLPICRPLFMTDPQDPALLTTQQQFLNNEFCVGRDLLIAPVLNPENEMHGHRQVYLPTGSNWYCYMDDLMGLGHAVTGGTIFDYDAALGGNDIHNSFLLPTYVRAGAVLPTMDVEKYVGEKPENPITFSIYPGKSGSDVSYLDDGVSRSSAPKVATEEGGDEMAAGKYREVHVDHEWVSPITREIHVTRGHDDYTPSSKFYYLSVLRDPGSLPLSSVQVNGQTIQAQRCTRKEDLNGACAWFHEAMANRDIIRVPDTANIDVKLAYAG